MLTIHTSNQLEQLKNQFSKLIKTPLDNVFATEIVVVQNAGMARWLSMQLADSSGVSANTKFLFPAEFMWHLLRLVSEDIPEKNQCTPETMRFHIMRELTQNPQDYPEIAHYIGNLEQQDALATWELSCEISQLMDQYLFYRSHWIRDWEKPEWNSDNNWQSRLWKRCVQDRNLIHWLALQDQFKQSFELLDKSKLDERITFFSMSALSPGYIDMLGELGAKTDVHLFMINPCEDIYWGDIQSEKSIAKMDPEAQIYMDIQNPLLASMGKQGRDFIDKLLNLPSYEEQQDYDFDDGIQDDGLQVAGKQPSLLSILQKDIEQLAEPQALAIDQITNLDNSLSINACHTAMREIEVLYDQILNELDSDPTLAPSDFVVMMPDVEKYAAYIDAVFSASNPSLPFSIADREALNVFQIIEALEKLFTLPDSRFDVESVFELLNYTDISDKFDLDNNQIAACRELAKATNIRWGINAANRKQNQLPYTEEHTWKYALDRILLGYSLGEDVDTLVDSLTSEKLFESDRLLSLLAFTDIEGSEALMLANFKQFTDSIFSIQHWHSLELTLSQWIDKTKHLIQSIMVENTDQQVLINAISNLKEMGDFTEFDQLLTYNVFNKMLMSCFQSISANEKYLGYGITFCALVPMRSVPFKVVALVGMNDGEFPRQDKHHSFDLMADKPLKGDRSRREEDRYLFLESILAARNKLLISFNGLSVKDNSDIPPSVLVNELLETVSIYTNLEPEALITKHPLQAFSPKYFETNSQNNADLYSYAKEYCSLNKNEALASQVFIQKALEEPDNGYRDISLADLISFYKNPARYFLKHRFSIQTFDDDPSLLIREPFELESFKDREIRNLVLENHDGQNDSLAIKESAHQELIARAKGLLPYGQIGGEIYQREKHITESFIDNLAIEDKNEKQSAHHYFNIKLGDFSIHGNIDQLIDKGRLVKAVTKPFTGDYISFWLTHLVLNAVDDLSCEKTSYLFSPDVDLQLTPVDDAKNRLQELLEYYWKGLSFPLLFFPKSGFAMYKKPSDTNHKEAQVRWQGSDMFAGEKDSFEHWLLHRTLEMDKNNLPQEFLDISQKVFGDMYLFQYLNEND
ncbi:exodeoxyribonuclease V subunit gamma [Cocleimonas sp. KMM 6892]|uniref:exodeoxyribonuclease V subunit gamma n=1 Tax=unclassified Cocleimonas TaxID=2639732 RepID=UPI002DBDF949|nr:MULTISPECIES: exodeoxyribonuclease V subunit gamma [unclassified Cocleimonas]MEB8432102.1 exodeoxyribonuclease V subunit gamma [Cocleimonas sp. KMM 6892]MEC4714812.1 exodeoxyribonuclease V subunit gamma [Cocleimonas sp. KMM 6895]MEC4744374.1 exodeoxyribonuclease V subunit gamma [Cocleimonas sp. KMM 6896]